MTAAATTTTTTPEKALRERVVASPFAPAPEPFDDQRAQSTADVAVVVPGRARPLRLHSAVLRAASATLDVLLGGGASVWADHDRAAHRVVWRPCALRGIAPDVLVAWLQFCYGAGVRVGAGDVAAALAATFRLGLRAERAQRALEKYAVRVAQQDAATGARVLQACLALEECHSRHCSRVDLELARCVLTRANLLHHYEAVVDRCLMALPPAYLDLVEYGDAHTDLCEFAVRMRYVRYHAATLSPAEKRSIVYQCDWRELDAAEIALLRQLEDLDDNECAKPFAATEDEVLETRCDKTNCARTPKTAAAAAKNTPRKRTAVKKEVEEDPKTDNVVTELMQRAEKAEQERDELVARCLLMAPTSLLFSIPSLCCSLVCVLQTDNKAFTDLLISQGNAHEAAARGNPLGIFLVERSFIQSQKTLIFDGSVPDQFIEKNDLEKLFVLLKSNFVHPQTLKLISLFISHIQFFENSTLITFFYAENEIDNPDILQLSEALKTNTSLTCLDLSSFVLFVQ